MPTSGKILIIEDEVHIARFVQLELQHEGYEVEKERDGRLGLDKALMEDFDLILLDINLPTLSGMEVLRRLRQSSQIPVIMLTAKDEVTHKVMGLDFGANDYVTKPFAIEELLARIRSALKRNRVSQNQITVGGLLVNLDQHQVQYNKEIIELTKKEFDLLVYLAENAGIVQPREKILESVWGYDYFGDTNIVEVYIRYVRTKIDEKFGVKLIQTIRGVGYILKNE
ncbi:response regulator transcription factor [Pseudalkalibacillus salsuginis]|uniref:response regulator transcription factor n=1 Tax=Pseudalkalibacillus salsuginis TaxID=2910972 RepID=UPI001F33DDC1|nr:response regulator transcription factor [Pseudalkalibacillus salsuginis]MCF6410825.1 response regulator transcription factor [Pseudalkalibacillus salsuginis]